ncbi:hypothetical protein RRG08_001187 [Elysia crispata]|uniref:Uncharacterized protein n=1 Tax=Elysia crispata TaxID=231223 RepID=A0AAE1ADU3_9GAST|nr:hypothetical protein RRG08_001185 [Elysia crispata]KAK3786011.1 hypothetical protein RRG08_001187 [Elysia crispata]
MATRQRPPRGRLRLSPTPPLTHGGNNEPPREMATTSRPEQNPRLAGREMDENVVDVKELLRLEAIAKNDLKELELPGDEKRKELKKIQRELIEYNRLKTALL